MRPTQERVKVGLCLEGVYDKEQLEEEGLSARMFMRGNTQLALFLPPCVSAAKQDLRPEL